MLIYRNQSTGPKYERVQWRPWKFHKFLKYCFRRCNMMTVTALQNFSLKNYFFRNLAGKNFRVLNPPCGSILEVLCFQTNLEYFFLKRFMEKVLVNLFSKASMVSPIKEFTRRYSKIWPWYKVTMSVSSIFWIEDYLETSSQIVYCRLYSLFSIKF